MVQFKQDEASANTEFQEVVTGGKRSKYSCDFMLQMMPYVNDLVWKFQDQSYDALKRIFYEEYQDLKISWKTSYNVTCAASNNLTCNASNHDTWNARDRWETKYKVAWKEKKNQEMMLLREQVILILHLEDV